MDLKHSYVSVCRVALALCFSLAMAQSYALSFGEIRVTSVFNEPLKAYIPIYQYSTTQLQNLTTQIASDADYENAGVERNPLIYSLRFRIVTDEASNAFIEIYSNESIVAPYLDLLVQLNWGSGTLIRQYSLLFDFPDLPGGSQSSAVRATESPFTVTEVDRNPGVSDISGLRTPPPSPTLPPDTTQGDAAQGTIAQIESVLPTERGELQSPPQPAQAPTPSAPDAAGSVSLTPIEPAPKPASKPLATAPVPQPSAPAPAPPAPEPAAPAPTPEDTDLYYDVVAGDTLYQIARQYSEDDSQLNQMMLAFLRENPEAFYKNNISYLKKGSTLKIPSGADINDISRNQALREVQAQYDSFHARNQFATIQKPPAIGQKKSSQDFSVLASKKKSGAGGSVSQQGSASSSLLGDQLAKQQREEAAATRLTLDNKRSELTSVNTLIDNTNDLIVSQSQKLAALQAELQKLNQSLGRDDAELQAILAEGSNDTGAPVSDSLAPQSLQDSVTGELSQVIEGVFAGNIQALINSPIALVALFACLILAVLLFNLINYFREMLQSRSMAVDDQLENSEEETKDSFFSNLVNKIRGMLPGAGSIEVAGAFGSTRITAKSDVASLPAVEQSDSVDVIENHDDSGIEVESEPAPATDKPQDYTQELLEEIGTYLGYGLYEQAEIVLKEAIENDPDHTDLYQEKLLEVHHASKDKEKFKEVATKIKESGDEIKWDRAVFLGKDLMPNDPMFIHEQSSSVLRGAEVKAERPQDADLDIGDGSLALPETETDFDVVGVGGATEIDAVEDLLDIVGDASVGTEAPLENQQTSDIPLEAVPQESAPPSDVDEGITDVASESSLLDFPEVEGGPEEASVSPLEVAAEDPGSNDIPMFAEEQDVGSDSQPVIAEQDSALPQTLSEHAVADGDLTTAVAGVDPQPSSSALDDSEEVEKTQAFDNEITDAISELVAEDAVKEQENIGLSTESANEDQSNELAALEEPIAAENDLLQAPDLLNDSTDTSLASPPPNVKADDILSTLDGASPPTHAETEVLDVVADEGALLLDQAETELLSAVVDDGAPPPTHAETEVLDVVADEGALLLDQEETEILSAQTQDSSHLAAAAGEDVKEQNQDDDILKEFEQEMAKLNLDDKPS